MSTAEMHLPSERIYKYSRRQQLLYLLVCVFMAIGGVYGVLTPGEQGQFVVWSAVSVYLVMFALHLVTRSRDAEAYKAELKRIVGDEWLAKCQNRARHTALFVGVVAQVPLIFFTAYAPPDPTPEGTAIGMGTITVGLLCGVWIGSFLYYSRAGANG